MLIRLTENEQAKRTQTITERNAEGHPIKMDSSYGINKTYSVQYLVKETSIFGNVKDTYWVTLIHTDNKEEAEEVYEWMVENDTIRSTTKVLKENEIDFSREN